MDHSSFRRVIDTIKEYWFLVTIIGLAALSIAYMVVFRVNPWDKQRSAKLRRERVRFHNAVGNALLEAGSFKVAKNEFNEALKLAAVDHAALNGRYLAELFVGLDQPDWSPAVGLAIQNHLAETGQSGPNSSSTSSTNTWATCTLASRIVIWRRSTTKKR
jgi:hypothetical protein